MKQHFRANYEKYDAMFKRNLAEGLIDESYNAYYVRLAEEIAALKDKFNPEDEHAATAMFARIRDQFVPTPSTTAGTDNTNGAKDDDDDDEGDPYVESD